MKKVIHSVIFLFLLMSNIFWMPFLGNDIIRIIQFSLSIFIVLLWINNIIYKKTISKHLKTWPIYFLIFLFLSLPGLLQAKSSFIETSIFENSAFSYVLNVFLTLLFSSIFIDVFSNSLSQKKIIDLLFKVSVSVVFIWAFMLILFYDQESPITSQPFWSVGFNFKNNKWSITLAFMFAIIWPKIFHNNEKKVKVLSIIMCVLITLGVIISTGRAGLLAIFLIVLIDRKLINRYYRYFIYLLIFTSILYIIDNYDIEFWIKLILNNNDLSMISLDDLSGGRIRQILYSLIIISENLFFGIGIDNIKDLMIYNFGNEWNVHNLILRLTVESGLFLGIYMLIILLYIFKISFNNYRISYKNHLIFLVILVGLVVSLVEPNMIVGTFQFSVIWWLAVSLSIVKFKNKNGKLLP